MPTRSAQAVAKNRLQLLGNQALEEMQEAEAALLDLLAGICQFDMQSGYTELCVGRIQAALEFTLLTPAWSIAVPGPGVFHNPLIPLLSDSLLCSQLMAGKA